MRSEEGQKYVIDNMTPYVSRLMPRILGFALWAVAILLFVLVLQSVSLPDIWNILRRLRWWQIWLLAIANGLVLLLMNGRWWLILRGQGYSVPYLTLTGYRLAGAGLSYLTPGPQFGGEPLQVLLIERNHQVPRATAIAAIALDKTFELIINASFLVAGIILVWQTQLLGNIAVWQMVLIPFLLLSLPLTFLFSLQLGWQPFTCLAQLISRFLSRHLHPHRLNVVQRLQQGIQASEQQLIQFCHGQPHTLTHVFLISWLAWGTLMTEFWLMLSLLGIPLTFTEMLITLTAARIAILLPLPGGLGTLEASQVIVLTRLGFSPATALSFSLLVRVRDVLLSCLGLVWAKAAFRPT